MARRTAKVRIKEMIKDARESKKVKQRELVERKILNQQGMIRKRPSTGIYDILFCIFCKESPKGNMVLENEIYTCNKCGVTLPIDSAMVIEVLKPAKRKQVLGIDEDWEKKKWRQLSEELM